MPTNYQTGFQPAASPVMEQIEDFHRLLFWIIVAVCLFVLALLVWIVVKYRAGANAVPSKVHHNTLLEVAWTLIPVIILVFIAMPSFRCSISKRRSPSPTSPSRRSASSGSGPMNIPAPPPASPMTRLGLSDADAAKADKPRLLGVDNPIYVPVNKVIEIDTIGADVIHSWAMPQMGVKMDAVPGRINQTWFKATQTGVFYGQCSELCGARHAYMPIELHVVTDADYAAWLAESKKNIAALENDATRVASK